MSNVDDAFGSNTPLELETLQPERAREPTWFILEVEPERMSSFGMKERPVGLSGMIRRHAFRHPEYHARRWMLLGLAERIDRLRGRVSSAAFAPLFWILRANRRRVERRRTRRPG